MAERIDKKPLPLESRHGRTKLNKLKCERNLQRTDGKPKRNTKQRSNASQKLLHTKPNLLAGRTTLNYQIKPVIPVKKAELLSVAKAMHREDFGLRVQTLFECETTAALSAVESGVYIGWRCPEYTWDCIRLGEDSRCFCNHKLSEHMPFIGKTPLPCNSVKCTCKSFAFIPERPEDIGEWWLQKRPGFDIALWRAKCKCKHTHDKHDPRSRRCRVKSCVCFTFESGFLCAACDKHWEDHETFFDYTNSRLEKGLPAGQSYVPFNEIPEMRDLALSGKNNNSIRYRKISSDPCAIPIASSTELAVKLNQNSQRT